LDVPQIHDRWDRSRIMDAIVQPRYNPNGATSRHDTPARQRAAHAERAGYFDQVIQPASNDASTLALRGSTEEQRFA
jgi:hypothetical protein